MKCLFFLIMIILFSNFVFAIGTSCTNDFNDYEILDRFNRANNDSLGRTEGNISLWNETESDPTNITILNNRLNLTISSSDFANVSFGEQTGVVSVEFVFNGSTGGLPSIFLRNATLSNSVGIWCNLADNKWYAHDGGWSEFDNSTDCNAGEDYLVQIVANYPVGNQSIVYINQSPKTQSVFENNGFPAEIKLGESGSVSTWQIDNLRVYTGLDCPELAPPTNSSWNVTSFNVVGNRTVWNDDGLNEINISSDLASLTVTANENSNFSCRLDVEQNYTEMVTADINYKAATTETTEHSITVFDSISEGNHCLYCSFIDNLGNEPAAGTSSSSCLNLTRLDSCTAPVSGNWNVTCSDNCTLNTNQNVPGNISITGSGTITLSKNLTFTGSEQHIAIGSGCDFVIESEGSFR